MTGRQRNLWAALLVAAVLFSCAGCASDSGGRLLVNVSYDATREFYEAYNDLFCAWWEDETGERVTVGQSHGGSGAQARSVLEGADADVVSLALARDVSLIEQDGLIDVGWEDEMENDSAPYTSIIVFLVRAGNEKSIQDWDDLTRDGVDIVTPDPKSSGGACWSFLAAWGWALEAYDGDEVQAAAFMGELYGNVLVMDSGARGATTTFVENGQGDVLIAWENEALQAVASYPGEFEIVTPSVSVLAQPSVTVVDANAEENGTADLAAAYVEYLYSEPAQRLAAEYGFRPSNAAVLAEYADRFDLDVALCTVDDFGGWDTAYERFFADGGVFDEIYGG